MKWWPLKRKKPQPVIDDGIIASMIRDHTIKRINDTDLFTVSGTVYRYGSGCIIGENGAVFPLSKAAYLFLGAHIISQGNQVIH